MTIQLSDDLPFNLRRNPSAREKLLKADKEALLGPGVGENEPPRIGYVLLGLSNAGWEALFSGIIMEVLEKQRQNWVMARRGGNFSITDDDILADIGIREVYYELLNLRHLLRPIGGTNVFIQMADDGSYTLPSPNVQFITIKEVIEYEASQSPGYDPSLGQPDALRPGIITHVWGFDWTIDKSWDGVDKNEENPLQPGETHTVRGTLYHYNPNWPYIILEGGQGWSNTENRLTDLWELQYLVTPAKGEKGDPGENGQDGKDGTDGQDGSDGTDGTDGQDGAPGPKGDPGEPGPQGDPGTPGGQGDPGPPGGGSGGPNPTPPETPEFPPPWDGSGEGRDPEKICNVPIQIASVGMQGLRNLLPGPQLVPVNAGNLNIRPAINQVGNLTWPGDYKPRNLVSVTLVLDMMYLESETIPNPVDLAMPITYTPADIGLLDIRTPAIFTGEHTVGRTWAWGNAPVLEADFNVVISDIEHAVNFQCGLFDFTDLEVGDGANPLGCTDLYFDFNLVPIPLIAAVLQQILNGRTEARLFVRCMSINFDGPDILVIPYTMDFEKGYNHEGKDQYWSDGAGFKYDSGFGKYCYGGPRMVHTGLVYPSDTDETDITGVTVSISAHGSGGPGLVYITDTNGNHLAGASFPYNNNAAPPVVYDLDITIPPEHHLNACNGFNIHVEGIGQPLYDGSNIYHFAINPLGFRTPPPPQATSTDFDAVWPSTDNWTGGSANV